MTVQERNEIWFDALLKTAASEALKRETDALLSEEELNKKYKPSAELDQRIKKIIVREGIRQKIQIHSKIIYKIAACIVIILAASSVTLLSVEATRNAIFNAFIERFDKYTEIKFEASSSEDKQSNLYRPEYLPEGFNETSTKSIGNMVMIIYSDDAGTEILFTQRPAGTGTTAVDNENKEQKEVEINGNTAYLFKALTKDDNSVLLWQSEGTAFELTSQVSSEELIRIGNSIKK